jgi:hypothetical protein
MSTIVTRLAKGSSLSYQELDDNFSNLNTDKLEDITGESIGDLSDVDIATISNGQVLAWNASSNKIEAVTPSAGVDTLSALTDVNVSAPPTDGYVLTWDQTAGFWVDAALPASGIGNVVEDTTPQLGGNLDLNGNQIVSVSSAVVISADGYIELDTTVTSSNKTIYIGNNNAEAIKIQHSFWPSTAGTDGLFLKTDGAGNTSWATPASGISDIVADTTPQLGGNLDVNGNSIVDNANGTVNINGFAYGGSIASVQSGTVTAIQAQDRLTLNDTGTNLGLANDDTLRFSGTSAIQYSGGAEIEDGVVYYISFPFGTGFGHISVFTHPVGDPNRVQVAGFMSNVGALSGVTWEEVSVITPSTGNVLTWDGSKFLPAAPAAGLSDVVADTTPQLGGNLDVNGNSIVSVSNGNITLAPNGTGKVVANNLNYRETVHSLGTTSGTIAPNVTNGNVQSITLNGNITFNGFTSPVAGQSVTLIINTGGTNRTLTSTMKFANADKTLSTTNTTDIISVYYDGTNYWASLSKGFA